jgi:Protein of unknown function (DUF4231)
MADEITLVIGQEEKKELSPKMTSPALNTLVQEKDESNDSVITNYVPEKDTLVIQDEKKVKQINITFDEMARLIRSLPGLTPLQIRIIELRYLNLLRQYERRLVFVDFYYHFSRGFVSLGSVLVPALLSIQSPTASYSLPLYWTTWSISLLVTILHNFTNIFRFDKKFTGIHATLERLKTEGWQYFELSGRYSGHHGHKTPTHSNQYMYFVNTVEKIRLRQIEDEYSATKETEKLPNSVQPGQPAPKSGSISEQPVPSPMDPSLNRGNKLP